MNHLLPIPFILIAIIVLVVSQKYKLKSFETISKVVITIAVIWFIYEYAKYLGYDIVAIVLAWF
jgi:hypothetical protein